MTKRASSEAANATTAATSSGSPRRPNAEAAAVRASSSPRSQWAFMSVSTTPGATTLTVMPRGASSFASVRAMTSMAALDIAYASRSG